MTPHQQTKLNWLFADGCALTAVIDLFTGSPGVGCVLAAVSLLNAGVASLREWYFGYGED